MNRIILLLFILIILSPAIRGQQQVHEQLKQQAVLIQKGQYDQAIQSIQLLISGKPSGSGEVGQAWTLLGLAYEQQGHYQRAQSAYEQALHLLEHDAQHLPEYANACVFFASLNTITHHPDIAAKMWTKAVNIHKQLQDHRALAKDYAHFAAIEITKNHMRAVKKTLEQAIAEAKLAGSLSSDDSIFLSDTQAWIDNLKGDSKAELVDYLHSLELRKNSHSGSAPNMGWAYLYVGSAYADNNNWEQALTNIRQGLTIIQQSVGQENPQYLAGEAFYARVLDRHGMHDEAEQLKKHAVRTMSELYRSECVGCTVSVASLR